MQSTLTSPSTRRLAWKVLLLAALAGGTGNIFLGILGALTGGIVLLLGQRDVSPSEADLIVGLSMLTSAMAMVAGIIALTTGCLILITSPARFCAASTKLSSMMNSQLNSTAIAGELYIAADGGAQNSTTPLTPDIIPSDSTPSPKSLLALEMIRKTNAMACGDMAGLLLFAVSAAVICFGAVVLLPLASAALRISRVARRVAGCFLPDTMIVPSYANSGHRNVAVAVPVGSPVHVVVGEARTMH